MVDGETQIPLEVDVSTVHIFVLSTLYSNFNGNCWIIRNFDGNINAIQLLIIRNLD